MYIYTILESTGLSGQVSGRGTFSQTHFRSQEEINWSIMIRIAELRFPDH